MEVFILKKQPKEILAEKVGIENAEKWNAIVKAMIESDKEENETKPIPVA